LVKALEEPPRRGLWRSWRWRFPSGGSGEIPLRVQDGSDPAVKGSRAWMRRRHVLWKPLPARAVPTRSTYAFVAALRRGDDGTICYAARS